MNRSPGWGPLSIVGKAYPNRGAGREVAVPWPVPPQDDWMIPSAALEFSRFPAIGRRRCGGLEPRTARKPRPAGKGSTTVRAITKGICVGFVLLAALSSGACLPTDASAEQGPPPPFTVFKRQAL